MFVSKIGNFGYRQLHSWNIFRFNNSPAAATLYVLGKNLNPFLIALTAAPGAVLSNYLIFRFIRDRLMDEIKLLSEEINQLFRPISSLALSEEIRISIWKNVARSRILKTFLLITAGFIVASPLPSELAAALFGAIKFKPKNLFYMPIF